MVNLGKWIDRFDDGFNPILVKELRQAVRSRVIAGILISFLLIQVAVLVIGVSFFSADPIVSPSGQLIYPGPRVFFIQQCILLSTILVGLPFLSGTRMLNEMTDPTSELVLLGSIHPVRFVWGKFLGTLTLGLLIFSICAPFMMLSYLLRGIDLFRIAVILGLDFELMVLSIQFALLISLMPGGLFYKRTAATLGLAVLGFLTFGVLQLINFLIESELFNHFAFTTISFMIIGFFGYLFVLSTAFLSRHSRNSMVLVRGYLTFLVLGVGAAMLLLCWIFPYPSPWYIGHPMLPISFTLPMILLLSIQLLGANCEKDGWSQRTLAAIPKNRLGRFLSFIFSNGGLGGILHGALMILLVLALALLLGKSLASPSAFDPAHLLPFAIIGLYAFCYSLIGFLTRCFITGNKIDPKNTWMITFFFFVLLVIIPNVAILFLYNKPIQKDIVDFTNLFNPFHYLATRNWFRVFDLAFEWKLEVPLLIFLGISAMVLSTLALPIFLMQFSRFRRHRVAVNLIQRNRSAAQPG